MLFEIRKLVSTPYNSFVRLCPSWIFKLNIKLHECVNNSTLQFQVTSIEIGTGSIPLKLVALYSSSRYRIKENDYIQLFDEMGNRFIISGDFNTSW